MVRGAEHDQALQFARAMREGRTRNEPTHAVRDEADFRSRILCKLLRQTPSEFIHAQAPIVREEISVVAGDAQR